MPTVRDYHCFCAEVRNRPRFNDPTPNFVTGYDNQNERVLVAIRKQIGNYPGDPGEVELGEEALAEFKILQEIAGPVEVTR